MCFGGEAFLVGGLGVKFGRHMSEQSRGRGRSAGLFGLPAYPGRP